jgi:oxygen-dependent protoporphyrinogen oxidase
MNIAILGGGVTGLTAAWRLSKAGHRVTLLESAPRVGGNIRTERADGWLAEAGPNSFQEATPEIAAMIRDLGLGSERITTEPAAKKRFLVQGGRLLAAPAGPGQFFSTPLFSFGTKVKILSEVLQSPRSRPDDVSVATFVSDHVGRQVLDRAVQPFIGGIYAGDSERLSARHAFPKLWEAERTTGSLIRAAIKGARKRRAEGQKGSAQVISFVRGLQSLTDALAAHLPAGSLELGADVRRLSPGKASRWSVAWEGAGGSRSGEFDWVIAALPAWSLARLRIGEDGGAPLSALSAVEYSPVASLFLGYPRGAVSHPLDGFGALVPKAENRSILGLLFSSSLFPGRAPEGHVGLTVFTGGALQPAVARLPEAELLGRVRNDLRDLVGAQGEPSFVRHVLWERAIPQYNLGYGRHLEAMAACEARFPGLLIGGSVRDGIALPDCIRSGTQLALRVS